MVMKDDFDFEAEDDWFSFGLGDEETDEDADGLSFGLDDEDTDEDLTPDSERRSS